MQTATVQPISERVNDLTRNIDVVGPEGIVRLMRQCDVQLFAGWEEWESMSDSRMLEKMERLADSILPSVRAKSDSNRPANVKIVMSGAGTSGRLSFFVARNMNRVADSVNANVRFEYLMAGHDLALIKSQEVAEDDVVQSIQDLKTVTEDDENCDLAVYIGITCGLSAPYVGSQINWILNTPHNPRIRFITVLMGFNDSSMARKTPIEGYSKTMFDIVSQCEDLEKTGASYVLNPILGPEPIAGSSRMKGGSATKIILDMIAARVLHRAFSSLLPFAPALTPHLSSASGHLAPSSFISMIDIYERTNRWTYLDSQNLSRIVALAGASLKARGHIYYLGEDSISMISLIDASECPPTFGAEFSDVRAFVPGGWASMSNKEGDMSKHGVNYQISEEDFKLNVVPSLKKEDLVIVLYSDHQSPDVLVELIKQCKISCSEVKMAMITWSEKEMKPNELLFEAMVSEQVQSSNHPSSSIGDAKEGYVDRYVFMNVRLPGIEVVKGIFSLVELSAKWILNTISTGAHIIKGKVWSNRMIDLNLSNDKLFRRGIELVSQLLSLPPSSPLAHDAILKSIHSCDEISQEIRDLPISKHYQAATKKRRVVPIALLLASGASPTVQHAEESLDKESILRNVIEGLVVQAKR